MESFNWENLNRYTEQFKEWILSLFRKVHARIGHVEEDLYNLEGRVDTHDTEIGYFQTNLTAYYDETMVKYQNTMSRLGDVLYIMQTTKDDIYDRNDLINSSIEYHNEYLMDLSTRADGVDASLYTHNEFIQDIYNEINIINSVIDTLDSSTGDSFIEVLHQINEINSNINERIDSYIELHNIEVNNILNNIDSSFVEVDASIKDIQNQIDANNQHFIDVMSALDTSLDIQFQNINSSINDLSTYVFSNLSSNTSEINSSINDISTRLHNLDLSTQLAIDAATPNISVGPSLPSSAKHGDFFVVEEYLKTKLDGDTWVVDYSEDPKRTAYIWDASVVNGWVALDGNVDATNVYFKDGIDRTISFGVKDKNDILLVNEGKDMNLKNLLEYYLVREEYDQPIIINAAFNQPTFNIDPNGSKPDALYTYMHIGGKPMVSNTSLCYVGTNVSIGDISLQTNYLYPILWSNTGTAASIQYPVIKKYSLDGLTVTNGETITSEVPFVQYSYVDNTFNTATATIKLENNKGFTGIDTSNSISTITGIANNNILTVNAPLGTVSEGNNKITLSYSVNGASVVRRSRKIINADDIETYPVSNLGNIKNDSDVAIGVKIDPSDVYINMDNAIYNDTYVEVTGVYPIYTNAASVSNTGLKLLEGSFSDTPIQIPIWNYFSSTSTVKYFNFGSTSLKDREIYFPCDASKTFLITSSMACNPTTKEYTDANVWFDANKTITINGAEYHIWRCNTEGLGGVEVEITIVNS